MVCVANTTLLRASSIYCLLLSYSWTPYTVSTHWGCLASQGNITMVHQSVIVSLEIATVPGSVLSRIEHSSGAGAHTLAKI